MKLSVRNLNAWFIANLLILSGSVSRAVERAKKGEYILSVFFHYPSKKEFESCIKWLKKKDLHFLSTSDLDNIIQKGLPFPKGGVLLTVDDGWQSNEKNIIEVADKYQVPVTIFISTAPVEEGAYWWSYVNNSHSDATQKLMIKEALKKLPNRDRLLKVDEFKKSVYLKRDALTIEQVKRAAGSKYVTIGGHTHTHPILTNCNEEEVYAELQLSKEKLEAWTGKEVTYFAYPNGDYSKREMQMLRELKYRLAYCCETSYLTPDVLKENYAIPRFGFLEGASAAENICRMAGIWKPTIKYLCFPFVRRIHSYRSFTSFFRLKVKAER